MPSAPLVKKRCKQDTPHNDLHNDTKTERSIQHPGLELSFKPSYPPVLNHAPHKGPHAKVIRQAAHDTSWPHQQIQLRRAPQRIHVAISQRRPRGPQPTAYSNNSKLLTTRKVSNTLPQPHLQLQIRVHVDTPYDPPHARTDESGNKELGWTGKEWLSFRDMKPGLQILSVGVAVVFI